MLFVRERALLELRARCILPLPLELALPAMPNQAMGARYKLFFARGAFGACWRCSKCC